MFILGITPGRGFEPEAWRRVLAGGVDGLLVREKALEARSLLEALRFCQREAPAVELWVAGRLDVALAVGCGLHAPEGHPDLPSGLAPLSRPLHALEQASARAGADQLLLSPVFATPGKGPALGVEGLHAWLEILPPTDARLLALGGIGPANVAPLRHPRLGGVALIRALWEAADPARVVSELRAAWA